MTDLCKHCLLVIVITINYKSSLPFPQNRFVKCKALKLFYNPHCSLLLGTLNINSSANQLQFIFFYFALEQNPYEGKKTDGRKFTIKQLLNILDLMLPQISFKHFSNSQLVPPQLNSVPCHHLEKKKMTAPHLLTSGVKLLSLAQDTSFTFHNYVISLDEILAFLSLACNRTNNLRYKILKDEI